MERWQCQRYNECLFQYMRVRSLTGHLAPISLVRLLWHWWGLLPEGVPKRQSRLCQYVHPPCLEASCFLEQLSESIAARRVAELARPC
jgi:hypothetical protein